MTTKAKTNGRARRVTIPCPHCRGHGLVELPAVYAETLARLRAQHREINAADLGRLAGVRGEAMANRLARLEALGLAVGRRNGRERMWSAKEDRT